MIYPSADIIEERVGSRYSLVVLAAKRAKQIKEGAPVLIETASTNPLTIALEEIAAGKVTIGEALPVAADHVSEPAERPVPSLLDLVSHTPSIEPEGDASAAARLLSESFADTLESGSDLEDDDIDEDAEEAE